jgi:hypothetical protein
LGTIFFIAPIDTSSHLNTRSWLLTDLTMLVLPQEWKYGEHKLQTQSHVTRAGRCDQFACQMSVPLGTAISTCQSGELGGNGSV